MSSVEYREAEGDNFIVVVGDDATSRHIYMDLETWGEVCESLKVSADTNDLYKIIADAYGITEVLKQMSDVDVSYLYER